ncbi:hypothetical protein [Paraliobacillus salinarum]|uniref:hypothetical protein n=1 Tax=Paraliobacillus salinarum TaxID=1158996 RepID=UPI0015F3EE4B|nr:hypothetical protein [Paraliobacillus salinarum]
MDKKEEKGQKYLVSDLIYLFKKNQKWIYFFLLITILPPIIFNYIISKSVPNIHVVQDNNWIGFFGSYLGSIIGGVLTLLGVRLTITSSENQRFVNKAPIDFRKIDFILIEIKELLDLLMTQKKDERTLVMFDKYRVDEKIKTLMYDASEIDGTVYLYIKNIKTDINLFFNENWKYVKTDGWGNNLVIENKEIEFIKKLLELHENIDWSRKQIANHKRKISERYYKLMKP